MTINPIHLPKHWNPSQASSLFCGLLRLPVTCRVDSFPTVKGPEKPHFRREPGSPGYSWLDSHLYAEVWMLELQVQAQLENSYSRIDNLCSHSSSLTQGPLTWQGLTLQFRRTSWGSASPLSSNVGLWLWVTTEPSTTIGQNFQKHLRDLDTQLPIRVTQSHTSKSIGCFWKILFIMYWTIIVWYCPVFGFVHFNERGFLNWGITYKDPKAYPFLKTQNA